MPKDKKVEEIHSSASEKAKQRNIREGLSEIYQDEDGEIIDVQKLSIKPQRHWWFWPSIILFYLVSLSAIGWGAWYFFNRSTDAEAVALTIEAEKKIISGQEFYYTIKYENLERVGLDNVEVHADYPANFIFLDSQPSPSQDNNVWDLGSLGGKASGEIKVRGKIVDQKDKQQVILAEMLYQPANFTSEFKKVTSFDQVISDNGLDLEIVAPASALVNEEETLVIKYKAKDQGYLENFRLTIEPEKPENIKLLASPQGNSAITELAPWIWQVQSIDKTEEAIKIRFKFLDKVAVSQKFKVKLEYEYDPNLALAALQENQEEIVATDSVEQAATNSAPMAESPSLEAATVKQETEETAAERVVSGEPNQPAPLPLVYYLFWQSEVDIQVVKNNLNLNLIINGSDQSQSVDFGQTLNYSLAFSNKETYDLEDIVIMATLESDLLDWSSLADSHRGTVRDKTITWTKDQVPALALLSSKDQGHIDFSIKVKTPEQIKKDNSYQGNNEIKSYVQFQTASDEVTAPEEAGSQANVSNTIINKVNSDLRLLEQIRYFNDDNLAVGSGPLPPKVGETTSLRVVWQLDNTLHALNNVQVVAELPNYVVWDEKQQSSIGQLRYDSGPHQVIWEIDQLPLHQATPTAQFNIKFTPAAANRNQIMILLSGTRVVANDSVTGDNISLQNKAKTSQLDDDVMIDSSGIVQ